MKNSKYCCGFLLTITDDYTDLKKIECPHTKTCSIYENFRKSLWTSNKDLDVLSFDSLEDFLNCKKYDGSKPK